MSGGHGHGRRRESVSSPEARRPVLEPDAGSGKVLFIDAFSGVAGDMTIAALIDLGVPKAIVDDAVSRMGLADVEVRLSTKQAGAIAASKVDVVVNGDAPSRHYSDITALLRQSDLEPPVRDAALDVFRRLGEAESAVHGVPIDEVHFHEVGAVDALVDIVGAVSCLIYLGAEVVCSPLPMGRGMTRSAHGPIPLPAPATVACLRDAPTYDAGIDAELVTPTGAALVGALCRRFERWPSMAPQRIGWGAGTMDLDDRPNALRVVLGEPSPGRATDGSHTLLEANVDDVTGELAGHVLGVLLGSGAVDAWAVPCTMKKGRPGLTLAALAPTEGADRVAEVLLRESTSIGVRRTVVDRVERPRHLVRVDTPYGDVAVKVSAGPYGPRLLKPEFDDCLAAAERAGVPVREVIQAAVAAAQRLGD